MYCPSCRDEFRPGFTRCGRCDVDLVESLDSVEKQAEQARNRAEEMAAVIRMVDYCGFFDLVEARSSRDRLRVEGVHCEIAIREQPGAALNEPAVEEYWLRVDHNRFRQADTLLQVVEEAPAKESGKIECPACGAAVPDQESFCHSCGIRFGD